MRHPVHCAVSYQRSTITDQIVTSTSSDRGIYRRTEEEEATT